MQLSELAAYAEEKYHIREQYKWAEFPGFSVLCDPVTGRWAALLMRQWDAESGTQIELCDLKCGAQSLGELALPYLSPPFRMQGQKWIGVRFDSRTEPAVIFRLFDRALSSGEQRGFTVVLDSRPAAPQYRETALPLRAPRPEEGGQAVPERLRAMRRLYVYGDGSFRQECKNFYTQGRFMEDYEDDQPWSGSFERYFPTYHDLRTEQLRGYFTWRAAVRRGDYGPAPTSLAYIYLYELLNGIGADGVEDSLEKLQAFERGFLDAGHGDAGMRRNLRRWMLELAVVGGLPPETARRFAEPETLRFDDALAALRRPKEHEDGEIFDALRFFAGSRALAAPLLESCADEAKRLFAAVWRQASQYGEGGKSLFTLCFGRRLSCRWRPLANAVYWERETGEARVCELDACRRYLFRGSQWQEQCYRKSDFDRKRLDSLLRETDRRLRLYLQVGRRLRERPEDQWAAPFIEAVLAADRQAKREAARKRFTIRFDDLARIREDASFTRESLLTEEERREPPPPMDKVPASRAQTSSAVPLEPGQAELLRMLLRGEPVGAWLAARHEMASVAADALNEALYDALGDSAVTCEGGELGLTEDYREELFEILGEQTE